jgi:cytochrome d ubiquinol oxidase subunit I
MDDEAMEKTWSVEIPWVMGLIATRSTDKEVLGLKDLMKQNEERIRSGMIAYDYLQKLRSGDKSEAVVAAFDEHKKDIGYGLMLKRYIENPVNATDEMVKLAARDTIPQVPLLYWSFRIMVAFGFFFFFLFALAFYYNAKRTIETKRWLLRVAVWTIPLPWMATSLGWFVAEYGRQPWAIGEVLPTFLATSSLTVNDLIFSLAGFIGFYTFLLVIEVWLMFKFARLGPSSLHTGRYHHEQDNAPASFAPAE